MGKRIDPSTLPADFIDGEILYGADLNKIITILRDSINLNKEDIDKVALFAGVKIPLSSEEPIEETDYWFKIKTMEEW